LNDLIIMPSVIIAFSITAIFMFALQPVSRKMGLVDLPGGRKRHDGNVPIIGGIAIFVGMFSGLVIIPEASAVLAPLFVASTLLVVIGVLDDRFTLPAAVRLATQIAAVLVMVYGANLPLSEIGDPFGTGLISMEPATLIFTTLVTLTMINAYNLIDGADGLAGSMALVALLAVAVVAGYASLPATIALTISAAIVGFLIFNFPVPWNRPVRSFMGDAGSTLLGFTIVWVTIGISQGPERLISPVHCLWFASIPIYDCLTCFVRRALQGRSPLSPGRDHFHHALYEGGFTVRPVLGILTGLQIIYAVIGLIGHFASIPDVVMFTAWSFLGLTQRFWIVQIGRLNRHCEKRAAA
jgi:UDP-GlcNAc:undecaprenyl-phosphate GlcNAc-1-phosphate transferase